MPNNSNAVASYLKALYRRYQVPTRVQDLARELGRAPASVSGMLSKLERAGWVRHDPYQDVTLTCGGLEKAAELERRHALLERHLIETLGYAPCEAHRESERMEAALSDTLVARLEAWQTYHSLQTSKPSLEVQA